MPSADGHTVRAELKHYTQRLILCVVLHVWSKNSKVAELDVVRKSEKVSDLRRADRGGDSSSSSASISLVGASAAPF